MVLLHQVRGMQLFDGFSGIVALWIAYPLQEILQFLFFPKCQWFLMAFTLYSTSPFVRSGGSWEKLGLCASVWMYGISRLTWNMGWILY